MRKIWKEVITLLCFISIYCILVLAHRQLMDDIVVKELPYILILLFSVVVILWCMDKLKDFHQKVKLDKKMQELCNQYDLNYDDSFNTLSKCEATLELLQEQLKQDEFNLSTFEYRYRKFAMLTGKVMFEYNLTNDTICDSTNWHAMRNAQQYMEECIKEKLVHPEDAMVFENYFKNPPLDGTVKEISIRLCTKKDPTYHTTILKGIMLEGLQGTPEKFVGFKIKKD